MPFDEKVFDRLLKHGELNKSAAMILSSLVLIKRQPGLDELLAKHIARLYVRDPLVVLEETLDQDDLKSADHFEVWMSVNYLS